MRPTPLRAGERRYLPTGRSRRGAPFGRPPERLGPSGRRVQDPRQRNRPQPLTPAPRLQAPVGEPSGIARVLREPASTAARGVGPVRQPPTARPPLRPPT